MTENQNTTDHFISKLRGTITHQANIINRDTERITQLEAELAALRAQHCEDCEYERLSFRAKEPE